MKKSSLIINILFGVFLLSGNAFAIDYEDISSRETNCSMANVNDSIYIPNNTNSYSTKIFDAYWSQTDRYIAQAGTRVRLWRSDPSLVSACTNVGAWGRYSEVTPGGNIPVIAVAADCTFNKPANPSNRQVQFVFNIRWGVIGGGTQTVNKVFHPLSGWFLNPAQLSSKQYTNYFISNYSVDGNECYNLTIRYCGDGVLDSADGETCDFNDASHTGWGTNGCDTDCEPIGGEGGSCTPGPTTGLQLNPVTAATAGLCPAGQTVGSFTSTVSGNTTNYTWSCNGSPVGGSCSASYISGGGGGGACGNGILDAGEQCDDGNLISGDGCSATCTTEGGAVTIPSSRSYCGNGTIERPNRDGQYETCDTDASWCIDCTVTTTNPGTTLPGDLTITTPGNSPINILDYHLIIGDGVRVFSPNDVIAFRSYTPMYLQNVPATITNHSPLIDGRFVSKLIDDKGVGGPILFEDHRTYDDSGNLVNIVYNRRVFSNTLPLFYGNELQDFRGSTDSFIGNPAIAYRDTSPSTSNGFYASLQYLTSPFNIRVSKPLIANTAGGNAFLAQSVGYSVDTVVYNFMNNLQNGNFTTSTVNTNSSRALSSATRSVSDNALSQRIASGGVTEVGKITRSSLNTPGSTVSSSIVLATDINTKSTRFSDTEAIRVFKDGNVSIDGNIDLVGVKTVIIENGNLIINKNIRYADKTSSFAWIVKNGNIIVDKDVTDIAGVYVTLVGSIRSDGILVSNRLNVDGSLYGDTSDLVANRTYVRGEADYTALNVGVIINYSNRAFINSPPLLSRFLEQYSLQRVAR